MADRKFTYHNDTDFQKSTQGPDGRTEAEWIAERLHAEAETIACVKHVAVQCNPDACRFCEADRMEDLAELRAMKARVEALLAPTVVHDAVSGNTASIPKHFIKARDLRAAVDGQP